MDKRPIGVFDSGLGGLSVIKELNRVLPDENIVYFGDTGRVPYGTKSPKTIIKYAKEDESFLLSHDVKLIIAACGTVSSVARETGEQLPVPFIEVVTPGAKAAVEATKNGKIGVIGTAATVKSGSYKKAMLSLDDSISVFQEACPLFVQLVEEGWINKDDEVTRLTAERYLKPLKEEGVDTLILGCTHYPLLKTFLRQCCGEKVNIISQDELMGEKLRDYLFRHIEIDICLSRNNELKILVSQNDEKYREVAKFLFPDILVEEVTNHA